MIDAVRTMRDLGPVLKKYNGIHFMSAREKHLREHGDEIDRVKKAEWLVKKLTVQLLIDAKALRRESRQLRAEVESLLPHLESMKAEMSNLYKIRSHIRKVILCMIALVFICAIRVCCVRKTVPNMGKTIVFPLFLRYNTIRYGRHI